MIPDELPQVDAAKLRFIRENAKKEPSEACARCGKPGAWVVMKGFEGRYHVHCGFVADYVRRMAERGIVLDRISYKVQRKIDRYTGRLSKLFGRE